MSGFGGFALYAIKLGHTGDLAGTDGIAWSHKKSTPYVPSPLLYQDRLYFLSKNDTILSVLDAKTGKPLVDAERLEGVTGSIYSSPVGAADRVYITTRNGTTLVLKKGDTMQVLAKNSLDDGFDASAAVAGNELYLRGKQSLYCLAESK
jgi:outer membrane protein assembly factor BamB